MSSKEDPNRASNANNGQGKDEEEEDQQQEQQALGELSHGAPARKEEALGETNDEENGKEGAAMVGSLPSIHTPIKKLNKIVNSALNQAPEEEQEYESPLPEDIFSLMYLCEDFGWAFFYSLVCFLVQMGIIILILFDLIDVNSSENPLKMPPGVEMQVTIAQGVAMVLAAATQTNLLAALSKMALAPSYDHEYVSSIYPDATKTTYRVSFSLQFLAGFSMLVANFILNLQSTTVLSLMLNFAALAFISEIQETAFWIAKHGYISIRIQEEAFQVANFHIPKQHRKRSNTLIKRICFVLIQTILLVLFGVLARQQRDGKYICKELSAQFGDEFRPDMAFFSDIYVRTGQLEAGRATYEDHRGYNAFFAYCEKEQVWTFRGPKDIMQAEVVDGNLSVPPRNGDPCDYWMKSLQTTTYDIVETMSSPWLVNDYFTNQSLPMDFFHLQCNDCEGARATQSCSGHGKCENNKCVCNEDRIGVNCEYPEPCPTLELDQRTEPFPYAAGGSFVPATSYELLLGNESKPVIVYNKPVYVAYLSDSNKIPLNVLMFTGRRYALFLNFDFKDATDFEQLRLGLPGYLPWFHSWFSRHRVYFFSEPMDTGTVSDWSSPVNLKWYHSRELLGFEDRYLYRVDHNQPTNTILLCPVCQLVFNDCLNDGVCTVYQRNNGNLYDFLSRSGTCECAYGFTGHLCEKEMSCFSSNATCLNDGNCTQDGSCSCLPKYAGKLCQYELDDWVVEALNV